MKQRHVQWLYDELPNLVESGVLGEADAERLRAHYGPAGSLPARRIAVILFGILGGMLIGSGIILLLAYNWTDLARPVRAVLSFVPLVAGQVLAGYTLFRKQDSAAWREGSASFLAMGIGASIALVGQTYHIPGNAASYLFTWVLLGLPLVYLLRSSMAAVLYFIGVTAWAAAAQSQGGHALWYWPLMAAALPMVWHQYRWQRHFPGTALVVWVMCLSVCVGLGVALERVLPGTWIIAYAGLLALLCLAGRTWYGDVLGQPFTVIGSAGTVVLGTLLTFEGWWRRIGFSHYRGDSAAYREWAGVQDYVLVLVLIAAVVALAAQRVGQRDYSVLLWAASPVLAVVGFALAHTGTASVLPPVLFNGYLFVLGLLVLRGGVREGSLAVANGGMGILALLFTVRFFDSEMSILLRGTAFILIGVGFLGANWWLSRKIPAERKETGA